MKRALQMLLTMSMVTACSTNHVAPSQPTSTVAPPTTIIAIPSAAPLIAATPSSTAPAAIATVVPATITPGPVQNGASRIAFAARLPGETFQIYAINSDGSGLLQLTTGKSLDYVDPKWSPDGQMILFQSSLSSGIGADIWVMKSDGTGQTNLTNDAAVDCCGAWSPDGKQIAFGSVRNGNEEIYVMRRDGSNPVRLTDNPLWDVSPVWSPDGREIIFVAQIRGNSQIYQMNVDGSSPRPLTEGDRHDSPIIGPNGQKIAYRSKGGPQGNEIWAMNADGSDPHKVSGDLFPIDGPFWSPDSKSIVFSGSNIADTRQKYNAVYRVDASGSNLKSLTDIYGAQDNGSGPWSPDGTRIVFEAGPDISTYHLYLMNADGTGVTRLTMANLGEECCAAWQPAPGP